MGATSQSVDLSLKSGKSKAESSTLILLSLIFSVLAMIGMLILIDIVGGTQYDIGELVDIGLFSVLFKADGSLNLTNIFDTLRWALPLVLTGMSVGIAFRAGLFNIGGQGQMVFGGVWAGIWAAYIIPDYFPFLRHPAIIIPTTLLVGILVGALWAGIPGLLKAYTGAHEVITTILMNFVAIELAFALMGSQEAPFVDRTAGDQGAYLQTGPIDSTAKVYAIDSSINLFLSWTILIVIATVIVMYFVLWKSKFGFKIRAIGFSPTVAESTGINSKKMIVKSMLIAGGLSGLAGAIGVIGKPPYRYVFRSEGTAGFDGIAVALIGGNTPLLILVAALFWGLLTQGKINLDVATDIPGEVIGVFTAIILLFISAPFLATKVYHYTQQHRESLFKRSGMILRNIFSAIKKFLLQFWIMLLNPVNTLKRISQTMNKMVRSFWFWFGIIPILILATFVITGRDLWSIFNHFTFILLVELIINTMPLTSLFVLMMPLVLIVNKYSKSSKSEKTEITKKRVLNFLVIFLLILEGFIMLLYILGLITGINTDIITFHSELARKLVATRTIIDMLRLSFPIMFAAIGATFNERSGIINIGLEGILLFSAWGATFFTFASGGDPFVGIIGGIIFGSILGFIHAFFTITLKAEQIVTGVAINLLALGLTDLFTFVVWRQSGASDGVKKLPKFKIGDVPILGEILDGFKLSNYYDIPVLGDILRFIPDPLSIIDGQSIILLLAFLLIPLCHFLLFNTNFGLRLRAIGEEPQAAATAGIPVRKYQYIAVVFSALLTSIGGVFMSIGDQSRFVSGMSSNRGFLGLAAMIFGKWTVIGSALSSLFFGYFFSLSVAIKQLVPNLSQNFFNVIPYIIALGVLAGVVGRARPPKNIGKPYDPQE